MRNDFGTRPYKSRFGAEGMKKGGSAKKKKSRATKIEKMNLSQ